MQRPLSGSFTGNWKYLRPEASVKLSQSASETLSVESDTPSRQLPFAWTRTGSAAVVARMDTARSRRIHCAAKPTEPHATQEEMRTGVRVRAVVEDVVTCRYTCGQVSSAPTTKSRPTSLSVLASFFQAADV